MYRTAGRDAAAGAGGGSDRVRLDKGGKTGADRMVFGNVAEGVRGNGALAGAIDQDVADLVALIGGNGERLIATGGYLYRTAGRDASAGAGGGGNRIFLINRGKTGGNRMIRIDVGKGIVGNCTLAEAVHDHHDDFVSVVRCDGKCLVLAVGFLNAAGRRNRSIRRGTDGNGIGKR